jgi:hypothetical protein
MKSHFDGEVFITSNILSLHNIYSGPHAEHEIPISKFHNLPIHALNKVETDLYIVLGIGGWVAD